MTDFAGLTGKPITGAAMDAAFAALTGDVSGASLLKARGSAVQSVPVAFDTIIDSRAFGVVGDGATDNGPALNAALATASHSTPTRLLLPPGIVLVNTAISITKLVHLQGHGAPGVGSLNSGTTLRTTNTAITPFTLTGAALGVGNTMDGTLISDLAIEQLHPAPGAGWSPTVYPPFFSNVSAPGVTYDNICGNGVYQGISNTGNSGRLTVRNLRGQFFSYAVFDDGSEDICRYEHWHIWPFWSGDPNVVAWQQANGDCLHLGRTDNPFLDEIFGFGFRSGIRLSQTASGIPQGVQCGLLDFDSTKTAIWVDSGTNITMSIDALYHDGQSGISGGVAVTGASAIQVDQGAAAVFQIGSINDQLSDKSTVQFNSTASRSVLHLGSLFVRSLNGGAAQSVFSLAGVGGLIHEIHLALYPLVAPGNNEYLPMVNWATTSAIVEIPGYDTQVVQGDPIVSGDTYGMTNMQPHIVLINTPQANVAALTLEFPTQPFEGMKASASAFFAVTTLSMTAPNGAPIVGEPTTLAQYQRIAFVYANLGSESAWVRTQ